MGTIFLQRVVSLIMVRCRVLLLYSVALIMCFCPMLKNTTNYIDVFLSVSVQEETCCLGSTLGSY